MTRTRAAPRTRPRWCVACAAFGQADVGGQLWYTAVGLASFQRRQQLDGRLAGPSLPLDVGVSSTIPAAIRGAVILRDQHCQFPGGCDQPAAGCEVHHIRHQANGGPTSVDDCSLYCTFHHQVVIHRWGWTIVRHPDGTSTARSPDGTKVLHSHGPPTRPG